MNTKIKDITISIIAILAIMFIALTFVFMITNTDKIFAEPIDSIVYNFNQLFDNNISTGTVVDNQVVITGSTGFWALIKSSFHFTANHTYYIKGTNSLASIVFDGNPSVYTNNDYYTPTIDEDRPMYVRFFGNGTYKDYIQIFDLTIMFGNNIPDKTEIVKLIPGKYYSYTSGTPITSSYLQGQYDMLASVGDSLIYNSSQDNSYNLLTYYTDEEHELYGEVTKAIIRDNNIDYYSVVYQGSTCAYLPYIITGNTKLKLNIGRCWVNTTSLSQENIYYRIYAKSGGALTELWSYTRTYTNGDPFANENTLLELNIPNNIDGIIIQISENFWLANITAEYTTTNYALLLQSALAEGNKISYDYGYAQGYDDAKLYFSSHNMDSVVSGAWDMITVNFKGIGKILDVNILPNVPLWTFIAIPLILGLITFIYKLVGN